LHLPIFPLHLVESETTSTSSLYKPCHTPDSWCREEGGSLLFNTNPRPTKVRYMANEREVFDPSYFLIQTGRDNASILVWPGSHHVAAEFDRFTDACKAKEPNPVLLVHDKWTFQTYEKRLCGDRSRLTFPLLCIYRHGDLVHAGDAYNGPEPTVINHVHCTAMRDMLANSIFIRPFGN
jgi:hypothetical protein